MKHAVRTCLAIAILAAPCCGKLSEHIEDPAAGMNGGFEQIRSGLPVNWLVYAPTTIPSGRYELLFDRDDHREGEQSLHFRVEECSGAGGWYSPGIATEIPAEPGSTYAVRFWIKAEDCRWTVSYGGVSAKAGAQEHVEASQVTGPGWQRVERLLTIAPEHDRLRFELSITSPGDLWIDDVQLERVSAQDPRGAPGGSR